MKAMRSLPVLVMSMFAIAGCHRHEGVKPVPSWGISPSGMDSAMLAAGSITVQNNGPKVTYDAAVAYVSKVSGDNVFQVTFKFTSSDSLMLVVVKKTDDYNYHIHADAGANQLLYVIFDRDTLELVDGAIAIQPRATSNTFSTVTNVHTSDHGDFNGTIDNVVLFQP